MKTLNQFLDESTGGGVPLTPQELEIQKKMSRLNVRLARKRSQEMQKAKVDDTETAPEQVKEAAAVFSVGKRANTAIKDEERKKKLEYLKKLSKAVRRKDYHPFLHNPKEFVEPEGEELKEYSPTLNKRGGGKLGKSSIYSIKGKDESKKSFRKSHVKDVEDGYVGGGHKPTPGSFRKEDYYRGTGEKVQKRTLKWMKDRAKPGEDVGAPGLNAMKARTAEHKAKRGVKEEVIDERLGGKGYKSYTDLRGKKISGDWEDSDRGGGHKWKEKVGKPVKKKSPTYQAHVLNKEKVNEEDKAFNYVLDKLRKQYGSGVMTKGDKMPELSAAQKKKNAAIRAKRAKEDHRDPTEKASDGRYSDRHSNRGSD